MYVCVYVYIYVCVTLWNAIPNLIYSHSRQTLLFIVLLEHCEMSMDLTAMNKVI